MASVESHPLTGTVYVLIDPRTGEVRYVGWTIKLLRARLKVHLRDKDRNHRTYWIRSLKTASLEPIIRVVQRLPTTVWQDAERFWITYFKEQGCPLTNGTKGGDGVVGYVISEATRAKIRDAHKGKPRPWLVGRTNSEQAREKMSAAVRRWYADGNTHPFLGKTHTAESRQKISLTKKSRPYMLSNEQRARMSEGLKQAYAEGRRVSNAGKTQTAETKEKIRTAHKGKKHTPEAIENMRVAQKLRFDATGKGPSFLGRKHSDESRAKMSATKKRRALERANKTGQT